MKKLNLFHHIINMPNTDLAKEIIDMQILFKLPGLAKECHEYMNEMKLTDISLTNIKQKQ